MLSCEMSYRVAIFLVSVAILSLTLTVAAMFEFFQRVPGHRLWAMSRRIIH